MSDKDFLFWAGLGLNREMDLLHQKNKRVQQTIDRLILGGDLFRLGVNLVRDALTGIASAEPRDRKSHTPNPLPPKRPVFDSSESKYHWPPSGGNWNADGRADSPGELARAFLMLTYEEPRIVLESLALAKPPDGKAKQQISYAFSELISFIVKQDWNRQVWGEYWRRIGTVINEIVSPSPGSGASSFTSGSDFSVNAARAYRIPDSSIVMATGGATNPAGAFQGTAQGNKSIYGLWGFHGMPLGDLKALSVTWRNLHGFTGPFYLPPSDSKSLPPYFNVLVDFGGFLRVLIMASDGLNPLITNAIGAYSNDSNVLTYSWASIQGVLVVGAPVPGSVPFLSVGGHFLENAYRVSDLMALYPQAKLVDVFPNDNGFPAGCLLPAILVCSGDSNNTERSGKLLKTVQVNGKTL